MKKLLESLGVAHVLAPYETHPWFVYSDEKGITCSAEVRMGADGREIECEIQFLHDESDDEEDDEQSGGREQILSMQCGLATETEWTVKALTVRNKDYANAFYNWEEKGCAFFLSCVEALQVGELPDVDSLVGEKMQDDTSWGGSGKGKIGRKSPTIKPGSLLGGMKK